MMDTGAQPYLFQESQAMAERHFKAVTWSYTTNIYEVNLRQYTPEGTFEAFGNELSRLRDMVLRFCGLCP